MNSRVHPNYKTTYHVTNWADLPLDKATSKCEKILGKVVFKHMSTVLKARGKCQSKGEKIGAMDNTVCASATEDKITSNRTKSNTLLGKSCGAGASLTDLDSCDTVSLSGLQTCALETSEANAESTFQGLTGNAVPALSWATEIQPLFTTQCSSGFCHTGGNTAGNLENLDDCNLGYAALVSASSFCATTGISTRVLPGDPSGSFLISKLQGTQDCGSLMPLSGGALDPAVVQGIRSWIADGAINDCP